MIIGTAGHIDHGKTALVKALTGVDADRLAEEKARGITIDLGYAYTPLSDGGMLGFVDVPGHERFIHNMLAGTLGIDFALLVVAADDGPMPQTVEHLQILELIGITRGAVALTKCDRVDGERIAEVSGQVRQMLIGSSLAGLSLFPVSSVSGTGVADLRAHLESAASQVSQRSARGHFRLAVDRCFTVAGAGTVVTGTVFSGWVGVGDRLVASPSGLPVRVRGIHAQNRPSEYGIAGQRCALNLADVDRSEVQRGDWIVAPDLHRPTLRLDLRLRLLASEPKPLKHWTPVHAHIGAFHALARIALLQEHALEPGGSALAQLVLDRPTVAVHGDRLILRDASASRTIGGGRVLDAAPPARGRRSPRRLSILAAWEQDDPPAVLHALLEASPNGVDLQAYAANSNLTAKELEEVIGVSGRERGQPNAVEIRNPLPLGEGRVRAEAPDVSMSSLQARDAPALTPTPLPRGEGLNSTTLRGQPAPVLAIKVVETGAPIAFAPRHWERLGTAVIEALQREHETTPDSLGLNAEQLRLRTAPALERAAFSQMLGDLRAAERCVRDGSWWHLPGHRIVLTEQDEDLWNRLAPILSEHAFQPPRVRDLARAEALDETTVRQLLIRAVRTGRVYRVAHDHYFERAAVSRLAEIVRELAGEAPDRTVSAARFRDRIGTGRKLAIHILEFFDRIGFTRRLGDSHRLRDGSLQF
jgi:selenocysteine-specific elongation factor